MEKKFLDETTLTYLRNYIDGQDKVIYKTAADLISSTWTNAIGEINTILDDINGDIDEVLNKGY